ncbi:Amino acid/polyamine transporter I [Lasiodiplodia theobromae]|uniref:Amino acid/polyamine transporter I n=1 Tax=Lasiodiplodia theobromae TaxID=45133 RepID=UPI0015C35D93|nr:Amino acid/polyamine transporter I [Lasiodiplodia theobromae]KAF4544450.1 Amino acid/polyamine transporter I [Lasiodiplodia theobromae]
MPAARYYSGNHKPIDEEKHDDGGPPAREVSGGSDQGTAIVESAPLRRALHGRHMQMIAIGGSIGAGLFVGSGSALSTGGPASLTIGFIIVGFMLLCTMQALGELAVLYPVNGAYYIYMARFLDPAWGFAIGWDYALGWLLILPFEITAAGITIQFWESAKDIDIGVWIAVFMVALIVVQFFGVRGYGEVEFALGLIKILACLGFIILGIVIDCGGVPTDSRGYIGTRYWVSPGAFRHGFHGFCSVFVTAAFAFGGTELACLAAAEAASPRQSLPKATRQVFWRVFFFYIVNTFILGLIVPSDDGRLLNASGANTAYSPFVIAIRLAGIKVLPSVFNVVICIAVLSVANSATFGSTRTFQALASHGMAPRWLAYVDPRGRPLAAVGLQIAFAFLAFVNEVEAGETVFNWLLALSGLSNFFVWGSVCLAHIRFRRAWRLRGRRVRELPFAAAMGTKGSWVGLGLNAVCLVAQFYVALFPVNGGGPEAGRFFQSYLAAPLILGLYVFWKVYSACSGDERINHRGWKLFMRSHEMDLTSGMREGVLEVPEGEADEVDDRTLGQKIARLPVTVWKALI